MKRALNWVNNNRVDFDLGLLDIVDILIARAQSALNNGDLKQAESKVSLAESIDPDKSAILELRHKINNARNHCRSFERETFQWRFSHS